MNVPFVDLKAQYLAIKSEIDTAISDVILSGAFIGGPYVTQFEKDFASFIRLNHVIGCANGTDSLEIIMKAMGIGPGDEVIVPALSWFSTSEAVGSLGATPVFVDIESDYYTMNPDLLEAALTEKTKAIIPVHLYGQAANMPAIMAFANKHHLKVIEDCAQSHGAEINNQLCGTFGHAASFSFYPGKNLGSYGDAGAIATNDEELAKRCRMIANHGQLKKHDHQIEGRNSRLDGLQAAILSVKLKHIEQWTVLRNEHSKRYSELLSNSAVQFPKVRENSRHVFHLYVIQCKSREHMMKQLAEKGIQTAIHYPSPLPLLKAYAHRNFTEEQFPVAASACKAILSIPMFPELDASTITYVVTSIKNAANA